MYAEKTENFIVFQLYLTATGKINKKKSFCFWHLPVNPTFLRQTAQRFFFFFESLSPSLSSLSSLMEGPAFSLVEQSSPRNF